MTNNKAKVPEIRFKGYIDAWTQRKLGDFGKATGGTSIESEFNTSGNYKVISIGSYSEQSVYTDQNIRADLTEKTKSRVLNKDDLTMILNDKTSSGNIIGRVLLIDEDDSYVYNQRTQRIEPNHNEYEPQFLYQLLNAPDIRSKIINQAQGNTQIYVNWSAISELDYFVPQIPEQTAIGSFFRTLDEILAATQRKVAGLKQLKAAYLQQMFPQAGECVPRVRFAGYSGDWDDKKLGELGEIITGSTPSTSDAENYAEDGMIWVTPTDIKSLTISSTAKRLSKKGESIARKVPPYSILMTCIASIGKNTMNLVPASFNQQINALVPNENNDQYFLLTQSEIWSSYMKGTAAAMTMQIVNKSEFSKMATKVPPKDEQVAIGNFFRNLDVQIETQSEKMEKLKQLKSAYLQKMFI